MNEKEKKELIKKIEEYSKYVPDFGDVIHIGLLKELINETSKSYVEYIEEAGP